MRISIDGLPPLLEHSRENLELQLPDPIEDYITKIYFTVPSKLEKGLQSCRIDKIDYPRTSTNKATVWFYLEVDKEKEELENIFDNFHLAGNFVLHRKHWNTTRIDKVKNRWDEQNRVMYIGC